MACISALVVDGCALRKDFLHTRDFNRKAGPRGGNVARGTDKAGFPPGASVARSKGRIPARLPPPEGGIGYPSMRLADALFGRRGFALALVLLVAVAGYARGLVLTAAAAEPAGFTICHGDAGGTPSGDAVNHDCCDQCVLAAAAMPPDPPELSLPAEIVVDVNPSGIAIVAPMTPSVRTPRQSQGPPLA